MSAHQQRVSVAMKAYWKRRKAREARDRDGIFQFVPWHKINDFHARGWMVVRDLGPTHGQWSVLMWRCDCGVAQ